MNTRVYAFFSCAFALSLYCASARADSIRNLAAALSEASAGIIQPNPDEFASCADGSGAESCSEWRENTFKRIPYVDTLNPRISVDRVERLFQNDWNPGRFGGRTFLERQESEYATYPFRTKDRRYVLPFANLRGWMGLNHPPFVEIHQPLSDFHALLGGPLPTADHPFYSESFQRRLDEISGTSLTAGNQVEILTNHDSYLGKLDLIRRAEKRLWVTSMVFQCDASSSVLLDALAERVAAGVDVRMIIEGLYADTAYKSCLKRIRSMGIRVLPLLESATVKDATHITHNKFWIRDGDEAIVGGQNILDDENLSTGFNEGYRDTDAWIHAGPTVTDLDRKFAEIWTKHLGGDPAIDAAVRGIRARQTSEVERGVRGPAVFSRLKDPATRSQGLCRILSQEPGGATESIEPFLAELVGRTSEVAIFTTPHVKFDPNREDKPAGIIFAALFDAAEKRGVRVDLITNGSDGMGGAATSKFRNLALVARSNGHPGNETILRGAADDLSQALGKGSFAAAEKFVRLSANIHGWNYFRYIHEKIHFFDRRMIGIGSFNLDGHSSRGNRETELFCLDDSLILQAEKMLVRDLANSTPIRK